MSKITIDRAVVEQALDAFDVCKTEPTGYTPHRRLRNAAITALRAALEQPQVEQEPVAVVTGFYGGFPTIRPLEPATVLPAGMALYANPQPHRQPLTDQQIHDCFQYRHRDKATERRMITRSIEFAHGITGEQE